MTEYDVFLHPETKQNEVFFTNCSPTGFEQMEFMTKRKGIHAYDGNGTLLKTPEWFPVFLENNEVLASGRSLLDLRRAFKLSDRA